MSSLLGAIAGTILAVGPLAAYTMWQYMPDTGVKHALEHRWDWFGVIPSHFHAPNGIYRFGMRCASCGMLSPVDGPEGPPREPTDEFMAFDMVHDRLHLDARMRFHQKWGKKDGAAWLASTEYRTLDAAGGSPADPLANLHATEAETSDEGCH